MTETTRARVPAHHSGYPALSRLVAVPPSEFASHHWGRSPLVSRAAHLPSGFTDLLDHDAVDELLSLHALRAPFVRVAKEGVTLPDRAFTQPAGVGAAIGDQVSDDRILHYFADGSTIVLQALHRSWAPTLRFCQDLAGDLGHPVQANAYVTPAQNTGFADHYDVHDVFVLQIAGSKRWRIREPVRAVPLRSEPWTTRTEAVALAAQRPPDLEVTLQPGDCLYLPRGYLHAATALGEVSTHLTVGVHSWTRRHLADELTAAALRSASESESVRESLPAGVDLTDPVTLAEHVDVVRAALLRAVQQVDVQDVCTALAARHQAAQRAAPIGVLAQIRAAHALSAADRMSVRPHLHPRLEVRADGTMAVQSRAGELQLEPADQVAVERLLADEETTVADLGHDLARRLLLAGVVVAG